MGEIIVCEKPNILNSQVNFDEREKQIKECQKKEEKELKNSPYYEWAQLNLDTITLNAMTKLANNSVAMKIFLFLTKHMDGYNAVMASYKVIIEALELSKATVARGIKYLEENHFIHIMKSGTSNVYILNPQIVWKSWGNNMKYCEFPINIVLAQSEQITQKNIKDKKVKTVEKKESI